MMITQIMIKIFGQKNLPEFFLCKMPIDKACGLWYNKGGAGRAGVGRPGPISRSVYLYAKFFVLLAPLHMAQKNPEN